MNRLTALPIISSAFLVACAAPPEEVSSAAAEEPVSPAALVAAAETPVVPAADEVAVVEVKEFATDTGLVCEPKRRSGSRIARTVCTTREALAVTEKEQAAAAQAYARDLERERAMRDQQQRNGGAQSTSAIIAFQ